VCSSDLPRICEIRDCVMKRGRSGTYFDNFDNSLVDHPVKRKHFLHLEADLAGLDAAAWTHLKAQVIPLFERRHQVRGWQAAFDKLNETKAYNYLERLGCVEVAFIPVSTASGQKTPDLQGKLGTKRILCEVKTINPSDDEAAARGAVARGQIVSGSTQGSLPESFFGKLTATLRAAETQMTSYCADSDARRIVYVILNFDARLNEYVEDYLGQIQAFMTTTELPKVEVIFDVKPKFYSATSESPLSQLFVHSTDRSWAME
jgi:hypothetical protein